MAREPVLKQLPQKGQWQLTVATGYNVSVFLNDRELVGSVKKKKKMQESLEVRAPTNPRLTTASPFRKGTFSHQRISRTDALGGPSPNPVPTGLC